MPLADSADDDAAERALAESFADGGAEPPVTEPPPAGVVVDEFNVVDVSQEPRDGDPAHSGDSIVRLLLT